MTELNTAVKGFSHGHSCNVTDLFTGGIGVGRESRALYRAGILEFPGVGKIVKDREIFAHQNIVRIVVDVIDFNESSGHLDFSAGNIDNEVRAFWDADGEVNVAVVEERKLVLSGAVIEVDDVKVLVSTGDRPLTFVVGIELQLSVFLKTCEVSAALSQLFEFLLKAEQLAFIDLAVPVLHIVQENLLDVGVHRSDEVFSVWLEILQYLSADNDVRHIFRAFRELSSYGIRGSIIAEVSASGSGKSAFTV